MNSFNLIDDPWIPVRYRRGGSGRLGLRQTLEQASDIADLDCSPHERVSLIRLLVCVAQATTDAPEENDEWNDFEGAWLESALAYLARPSVLEQFALFGEGPRFLQTNATGGKDAVPVSKLVFHLATGNNPTFFDHAATLPARSLPEADLAMALLSFQCFYPLYGAGHKGKGPCCHGNMLHTIARGSTLHATILQNCLNGQMIEQHFPAAGMGRPIWELDPATAGFEEVAARSYLGRLVPRHRNLRLLDDRAHFLLDKVSLQYPVFEEALEPSATIVVDEKKGSGPERRLLGGRLGRSIWRDLDAVTVVNKATGPGQAPLVLQSHPPTSGEARTIWIGGLITDMKAKIHDTCESAFTVPYPMFTPEGRQLYRKGVEFAERQSRQLFGAVKEYGKRLRIEKPSVEGAQRDFWNALEQQVSILLQMVDNPHETLGTNAIGESDDPWSVRVRQAAVAAYQKTCPRRTPRQLRAYVAGLSILYPRPSKKQTTPTP